MNRAKRIMAMILAGQFSSLYYSAWVRLKRLDLGRATVEELGLSGAQAYHYGDSGGPLLAKVLRSLDIPPGSRIVDFGSGKGGALFTMARFPFAEVKL